MAKIFYTDLNLNGNQLLNAVVHNVAAFTEIVNVKKGQICYLTTATGSSQPGLYQYDGANWILVGNNLQDLATENTIVVTGAHHVNNSLSALQTMHLGNMVPEITTTQFQAANQVANTDTLQGVFGKFEDEVKFVKDSYVAKGSAYTSGQLLVAENTADTANTTGKAFTTGVSIQATSLNPTSNTEVPVSKAIAEYVGSFAGGIHYKGTVDANRTGEDTDTEKKNLPTTGVITGDLWIVKSDGAYGPAGKTVQAHNGDFFIASVNSVDKSISWQYIPIDFTVTNKAADVVAGGGMTTIATIDGTNITLQNIVTAGTATIATVNDNDVVTLHGGLQQIGTTGTIASNADADVITLAKVAKTGQAVDVIVPENSGLQGANVLNTLQSLQGTIEHLDVEGFQQVTFANDNKAVTFYGLQEIDGVISKSANDKNFTLAFQSVYNETTNPIALQSTVENAIDSLDVASNTVDGTNVHVTYKEENGIVTIESVSEDYATISTSKEGTAVTTLDVTDGTKLVKGSDIDTVESFVNTRISEEVDKLDVGGFPLGGIDTTTEGESSIILSGIKEEDGKISADTEANSTIKVEGKYNASSNKLATQSTITNAINELDVTGYQQMSVNDKTTEGTPSNGSIVVSGIQEVDGKISPSGSTTLNVDRGLDITSGAIGHTNSITAQTDGLGSSAGNATKVVTGLKFDTQGHITAAGETALVAANIANTPSGNLESTNIQAALEELQGDIDTITAGVAFRGEFTGTGAQFAALEKQRVGYQYIYQGAAAETILTKNVEPGDLIIVKTVNDNGNPTEIVVVERSLNKAVTNASTSLTTDKLVLGAGNNDTVKTSTYGVSATAIAEDGAGNDADILTSKAVVDTITNKFGLLDATVTSDSTNVNVSVTETDGKLTEITVSEDYATVEYEAGSAGTDSTITVTNDGQLVKGSDIANVVTFTNKRIGEEIAKLDADKTSDDAAVATVQVVEVDGKLTDVVVTNISAVVNYTSSVISTNTPANLTAATSTGAVTGADIATIKSYVDDVVGGSIKATKVSLTFNSTGNATITTNTTGANFIDNTIVEIRDSSNNVVECDVTYAASTITIHANNAPTGLYAIVHTNGKYNVTAGGATA